MKGYEVRVQYQVEIPESTTVPTTVIVRRQSLVACSHGLTERTTTSVYALVTGSTEQHERAVPVLPAEVTVAIVSNGEEKEVAVDG